MIRIRIKIKSAANLAASLHLPEGAAEPKHNKWINLTNFLIFRTR